MIAGESYESFFGFVEPPFSLAPNPRFLFESASHAAALAQVAQAIERREPLVVITGEIGTGKTLLCRTVVQRLPRKTFVSVVHDPLLGRDDLLKQLLEDFGLISKDRSRLAPTTRHDLVHALQGFLETLIPLHAHAVVIIDEAQHLQPDVLEQIRLLSNIDDERGTMLQIIVVGQRDLEPLLARPELKQFQQRISRRFRLDPLNAAEVEQYIRHRLSVAAANPARSAMPGAGELRREMAEWDQAITAGSPSVVFTPDAMRGIALLSEGVPRVINLLCDRALELAHAARTRSIDLDVVRRAAEALQLQGAADLTQLQQGAAAAPVTPGGDANRVEPVAHAAAHMATDQRKAPTAHTPGPAGEPPEPQPGVAGLALEAPLTASDEAALAELAAPARRSRRALALTAGLVLALAAVWFGSRELWAPAEPPAGSTPPTARDGAPPNSPPSAARTPQTPDPATTPTTGGATPQPVRPDAAATPSTAAGSGASSVPPSGLPSSGNPPTGNLPAGGNGRAAATGRGSGGSFELVVASFRTANRAEQTAADIGALGVNTRVRQSGIWYQVMAGPFASRDQAEAARVRLDASGFAGAQITSR